LLIVEDFSTYRSAAKAIKFDSYTAQEDKAMVHKDFQPGDPVIFRKTKHSERPGPRAKNVHPTPKGEQYVYEVDKFWVVVEARPDTLLLITRRGKQHVVERTHPGLRRPNWLQRWLYRDRFPKLEECLAAAHTSSATPAR
jgi:hypothetical protein